MKKFLSVFLTILMAICCLTPSYAFAAGNSEFDSEFTQQEFESSEHTYAVSIQPYSTGLITNHTLGIAKSGNNLLITGYTSGNSSVIKCGFTKVIIQRRASSSASWSNYKTFNDLYSESNYYKISKSVPVDKGYQYRVTATHYAKKSLLSTQKIDATTGYLSF